jgi:SH3 domain-containing protein
MNMRSALRLIPLIALGALAAFLLAGPLSSLLKTNAVASRPQPSASASVDPHASPTSCPASLPMPKSAPASTAAPSPALPFAVWVNDPLGVNLRAAASASGTRLATLTQGTQVTVDARSGDAAGNPWYHVTNGTQKGWIRADFVASTPLHPASGTGWSLMLPQGFQATSSGPTLTTVAKAGDDLPFLTVQTSTTDTITLPAPAGLRADIAPVADHAATIQVWSFTVQKQVSRVVIDTCKVMSAWARADQGWPYQTSVYIHTSGRNYQFTFLSSDPDSSTVKQVLDSIALS